MGRIGQKVLVGITTTGSAIFWSVPFLQFITRMDLSYGHSGSFRSLVLISCH